MSLRCPCCGRPEYLPKVDVDEKALENVKKALGIN